MLPREQRAVIKGIDVTSMCYEGLVYQFDQRQEIIHTCYRDGLCLGFTASLMRQLLNNNFASIQEYSNPLPPPTLNDAVSFFYDMIAHLRDGHNINSIIFSDRYVTTVNVKPDMIPLVLENVDTQGATLTYKTISGAYHTLLFFNKPNGRCVIQDVNRFTADNVDVKSGVNVLRKIVDRSNPEKIEISYTTTPRRARL